MSSGIHLPYRIPN